MPSSHLEIQTHRKSPVGIIRSSFHEQGKVKHRSLRRLTGLPLHKLKPLKPAFRGDFLPKNDSNALQIFASKEHGASFAIFQFTKQLGLHTTLSSRPKPWVSDCLALIAGRILYAGSKLSLSQQWKHSALW